MNYMNVKKLLSTACMVTALCTTTVVAGPGDEPFEVPVNCVRKGPSVGTVEKLTFENGQFTATIDGKTHQIKRYDVDKPIRDLSIEQLQGFLQSGKLEVKQHVVLGQDEIEYSIKDGSGLPGGGRTTVPVIICEKGKEVVIWVVKTEAARFVADNAHKGAKFAWKQTKNGGKKVWDAGKWAAKQARKLSPF